MKMKSLGLGVIVILATSLASSSATFADVKGGGQGPASYKSEIEKYREDLQSYRLNLKQYEEDRRAINAAFKIAIERALAETTIQDGLTLTQGQKRQKFANKRNAVAQAISDRDEAIAALGEFPIPPIEPMKPSISSKSRKGPKPPR